MHVLKTSVGIGMALIILNPIIGWGGLAVSLYLYKKGRKRFYLFLGPFFYVLSWGMLAVGAVLAGPEGLKITRAFVRENLAVTVLIGAAAAGVYLLHRSYTKRTGDGSPKDKK